MSDPTYLGIDFGTSGARAIAINGDRQIRAQANLDFQVQANEHSEEHLANTWKNGLLTLIGQIPTSIRSHINAIAINGTSSTILLCNAQGEPIAAPLLYNDARSISVMAQVNAIAPAHHTVITPTSSFAKLLWLTHSLYPPHLTPHFPPSHSPPPHLLHQADWLAFLLHGKLGITDYHNALKLGYDVGNLCYPDWLLNLDTPIQLPEVVAPGSAIAPIQSHLAQQLGLPHDCMIHAGTTDSIAAFLASTAATPGTAVTSLGSTLVLKLLSVTRVDDARYGIYSHRLGDLWLVGGASNTGGAVLRHFFTDRELTELSQHIDPNQVSPLDYYPLLQPGERFPLNDPELPPRLEPRPASSIEFLHGLLESMARIEANGYALLQQLGTTPLTQVYTAGGGAKNEIWRQIRSRQLQVPVRRSTQTEAAYGSALLAMTQ